MCQDNNDKKVTDFRFGLLIFNSLNIVGMKVAN